MSENQIIPDPVKAKMFAQIAHSGQVYNDEVPYTYHLDMVVAVLARFGITDPVMMCAGFTHDVVEDTTKSYNDVKAKFGEDVAELVYAVTSELGRNRKERNEKTYPKIRGNARATVLKLADRIANIEYGMASGGKNEMYAKEYPGFREALYVAPGDLLDPYVGIFPNYEIVAQTMWKYLDKLLGS